ncbi:MAG: (4Fe-4S)-binding protein [candidate division NC10 bacterium RBG_16_65_8]|nr:MAG: (4Fe-4S)-binding protein [candidate division NC10 bacterium RBG_16_65_8]
MKELVVLSGKGGTGKTSLVAAFAALADRKVLADCDVDAADLHLILTPETLWVEEFQGRERARIVSDRCAGCGACAEHCRFGAIAFDGPGNGAIAKTYRVDPLACEGCGVCAHVCPTQAVEFGLGRDGEWYISETRHGPLVHARLDPGGENSGKLVTLVRGRARALAEKRGLDLLVVDGSPGIGCPVIASVAGTDLVLGVTEPTLSGQHDLERLAGLTAHFRIPMAVCINKVDLNPEVASAIERWCQARGIQIVGRIPYDPVFSDAQAQRKSVVEIANGPAARALREVWQETETTLTATR